MSSIADLERALTGKGLIAPLRRQAGNDFLSATGPALVLSCIMQVLRTRRRELRWNPSFGVDIEHYRHANMSEQKASKVGADVIKAVAEFEPRAGITSCTVEKTATSNLLKISFSWQLRAETGSLNVRLGEQSQEVEV